MATPKFNAVYFIFFILLSLSALYECRKDGNMEQISRMDPMEMKGGVKLYIPPCLPYQCKPNNVKCWCCISIPHGPCWTNKQECINICPPPSLKDQAFP
uniref:Uncharacterized protein n=1 Tax=Nelumbo nucifera TaxID=4432 RepID=A0A822ZG51_NELNU|nr:TPA_asm: hypothetical protein HUJ06_002087 [Nelumbo nucifera]DAD43865.1 TPA_asm: hypothetical protein HUJ06_002095 [Nelumbo nucifera]DAD44132.1 TPA_asm: hypothetical protein HUJ06_002362 [Nelumbo nucifera]